jgi:hypothetical protein
MGRPIPMAVMSSKALLSEVSPKCVFNSAFNRRLGVSGGCAGVIQGSYTRYHELGEDLNIGLAL